MTTNVETKEFSLTIGERLKAVTIFDAFKGNISTLATIMDDVKQFPVTEDEWVKAELKRICSYKSVNEETKKELIMNEEFTTKEAKVAFEESMIIPGSVLTLESESWKWNETEPKMISLNEGTVEYLLAEIKKKDDAQEITVADLPLVSLQTKLKA